MKRHRHAWNLVGARDVNVDYETNHTVFLSFVLCPLSFVVYRYGLRRIAV